MDEMRANTVDFFALSPSPPPLFLPDLKRKKLHLGGHYFSLILSLLLLSWD